MRNSIRPEKKLTKILSKHSGRDQTGQVSVRHQGGRHKRYYRLIDFKRDKLDILGKVLSVEYDPNRTADIALVLYTDGDKRYILAPLGLKAGDLVISSVNADVKTGNATILGNMPLGTIVHNVELVPGKGGVMGRTAGAGITVLAKDGDFVHLKLGSGEIRKVSINCMATIGQIGNEEWRNVKLGKAGRARHMGKRPEVRGTAQNPRSHPHGGGEGRSGIGMKAAKSPWGKRTMGKITRNRKKYSNKYLIKRRK